jgi:hemerythrin-like metal-binding protein
MDISIWKDAYIIGVERIDQQHKQLLTNLERLLKAVDIDDDGKRKEECANIVSFTQYYAAVHFSTEERLQEVIGFPEKEGHKRLHETFTGDIRSFEKKLEASGYEKDVVREFADMLENWFVYHISSEDKKMIGYITGNEDF